MERTEAERKHVRKERCRRNSTLKTYWQLVVRYFSGSPEADKFGRSAARARVLYPRTQTRLGSFIFKEEFGAGTGVLLHQ